MGLDFVEETVIARLTNDEANYYEMEFISTYGRIDLGTGCLANMTDGGDGVSGWLMPEKAKEKIRKALKDKSKSEEHKQKLKDNHNHISGEDHWLWGTHRTEEQKRRHSELTSGENHYAYGKSQSKETIENRVAKITGQVRSKEQKQTISNARKLTWQDPEYRQHQIESQTGKKRSEDAKLNMSIAQKKRFENPENHPMYGRTGEDNPKFGIPAPEEQKRKQSISMKLRNKLKRWDKAIQDYISEISNLYEKS
jgi:hypothetical protein